MKKTRKVQTRKVPPSRRDVLGSAAAASVVLASGCARQGPAAKGPATPAKTPFEVAERTIAELTSAMAAGTLSARELTAHYLSRIEETNRRGPELRAVIEINPNALEIAAALDSEQEAGNVRGPLHGIPILLKDNIATADQMETTAGSLALVGYKPPRDAFVTQRLRAAGAVVLGKSNLSEWANIRSTKSSSGWSARGGLCRNPYVLDRTACGSSSGSAVATAANLCAGAIGTETSGSIICPASHNNLVGIKPTVGAVSRAGIIPISVTQDTAGPMTRTVADAVAIYAAIAASDPRDPATADPRVAGLAKELAMPLSPGALRGARIGVPRNLFGFDDAVDALMADALAAMTEAGAIVVDSLELPLDGAEEGAALEIMLTELKKTMADYLAELPAGAPRTLADLVQFNRDHADTELVHFGQELFEQALEIGPMTGESYKKALASVRKMAGSDGIDKLLEDHKLDALVAPTNGPAWKIDLKGGDVYSGGMSAIASSAGYPNITVPAGFVGELPIGISIFGGPFTDAKLARLAFDFERIRPSRRQPRFLPTIADPTPSPTAAGAETQ